MTQPDLDYLAPEIQQESNPIATYASDVFSFGLVVCSLFNQGKSLIQSLNNTANYSKHVPRLDELFTEIVAKVPTGMAEALQRALKKDPKCRPSIQYITMLKYFDDPVIECMKLLDSVMDQKELRNPHLANITQLLTEVPYKLRYQCMLPTLTEFLRQYEEQEKAICVLPILIALIEASTMEEYKTIIQSEFKAVLATNHTTLVVVCLLEHFDILMMKSSEDEIKSDLLPIIFNSLASNNLQCQEAALNAFSSIKSYLDEQTMRNLVLPRAKNLFFKSTSVRTKLMALQCVDKMVDSLEKMIVLEDILPFLVEVQCSDVDIVMCIVAIYKHLLGDRRFGLTHNLLATKVMPSLIPMTVFPGLNINQFNTLMEILHDMLGQIERQRLSKMINELPSQECLDIQRRRSMDNRIAVDLNKISANHIPSTAPPSYNQAFLNVNFNAYKPPSTPELLIKNTSRESLGETAYKRHASFQSLGMAEQAVFDMVRQRRMSQMSQQERRGTNPQIYISQASISGLKDNVANLFSQARHRGSTSSMGPVLGQDQNRRDSANHPFMRGAYGSRRSSFQGICESAMQFFGVK